MTTKLPSLKPTKTVYGFTYPETKRVVEELWEEKPHYLYEGVTTAWQDNFHSLFLDMWQRNASAYVDVSSLKNGYATNGSSEAIREVISLDVAKGRECIHVFDGEYEGYEAYATGLGTMVMLHDREDWGSLKHVKPGDSFFLSQPHSRDGNWWDRCEEFLILMEKKGVRVHLDLTYFGTGTLRPVSLTSAVETVFFSLSKVYGVYYHRIGGCFSREPIPNLYGNKWFKNMFSLELGRQLMTKHPLGELPGRYRHLQAAAIQKLGYGEASDVIMLAHSQNYVEPRGDTPKSVGQYCRLVKGDILHNRYCLTPLLEKLAGV